MKTLNDNLEKECVSLEKEIISLENDKEIKKIIQKKIKF